MGDIFNEMKSDEDIQDWNRNASHYSEIIESRGDRCFPEIKDRFWELIGDPNGLSVLDLGCGQGWLTKELHDRSASVIGIDGSNILIGRAKSLYPDLDFVVYDLSQGLPNLGRKFDIVISHMVVMDILEIELLFSAVSSVLNKSGKFIISLPHPCFFNQKSHRDEKTGEYFKKLRGYLNPDVWRIDSFGGHNHYHRSLTAYFTALSNAGLMVSSFYEPPHQANSDLIDPEFIKQFPVFLLIEATKVEPDNSVEA